MDIVLKSASYKDRIQLAHWLRLAMSVDSEAFITLPKTIKRLEREAVYYECKQKFEEEKRAELAKKCSKEDLDKIYSNGYFKELKERLDKAKQTYNDILSGTYTDAIEFLKKENVNDESLAYGKPEEYGGVECQTKIQAIFDMLMEFIHQKADNIDQHEFYNDEIDEWYFKYNNRHLCDESKNALLNKDYFFPSEVFIVKVNDIYFYYCETSGQGTLTNVTVLDDKILKQLKEEYGVKESEVYERAYDLKNYF